MLKNITSQFILVALLLCSISLSSQSLIIDYTNPDFIEVCDSGKFKVKLTAGSTDITNIQVEVWLPNGITYQSGSIVNASEFNISDLNRPMFSLPDLVPGEEFEIELTADASCRIISDINSGKLFANTITVNFNDTDDRIITQPYRVETGLLVITDISPETTSGQFGDIIYRRITIRNTRFSKIKEINMIDFHQKGLLISTNGVNTRSDTTRYYATFDASHFNNIGNRDDFFDFNEEIIITEEILINDCGEELEQTNSYITFNWGCNGEICQSTTRTATINIEEYTKVAVLEYEPQVVTSGDFCDGEKYSEILKVTNTGNDGATNLQISITPNGTARDTNSIVVLSNGIPIDFTIPFSLPGDSLECPPGFVSLFSLEFEELQPNQSIEISWENHFCEIECDDVIPPLSWRHSFLRVCPVDSIQVGRRNSFEPDIERLLKDSISFYIGRFLEDGERYEFRYDLFSDILDDSTGIIQINFNLPCGYSWPTTPFILDGKSPVNTDINNTGTNTFVTLDFELPFSSDHVWDDFYLDFDCIDSCIVDIDPNLVNLVSTCPVFYLECWFSNIRTSLVDLDGRVPVGVIDTSQFKVITTYISNNPNLECSLSDCEEFNLRYVCGDEGDVTSHPFEAYIDFSSEFHRVNIGLKDTDDNRVADDGSIAPTNEIRRDRFLTGDTSLTRLSGVIVNDLFPVESENVNFRVCFEGHLVDFGNGADPIRVYDTGVFPNDGPLFTRERGIRDIEAIVKIIDKDTGEEYECPLNGIAQTKEDQLFAIRVVNTRPLVPVDDWRLLSYTYSLNLPTASQVRGSTIPAGFKLTEGDSVYFEAKHILVFNPFLRALNLRHYGETNLYNGPDAIEEEFTCDRPRTNFQITGYQLRRNIGNFGALPCGEFDQNVGSNFNLSLGRPNFFTNEVRPLIQVAQWDLVLGFGYELLESRIVNMGMNNFPSSVLDQPITPTFQSGVYKFNLLQFQDPLFDEGFYFNIYHKFNPLPIACSFEEGSTLQLITTTNFLFDFLEFPDVEIDTLGSTTGFTPLIADLEMKAANPNYVSNDNTAQWDLKLENNSGNEGKNVWIYFESGTNRIFDFSLTSNGQTIPENNGIYQLGDFVPGNVMDFNLGAEIDFCGLDSLDIYYGWNCDPLESIDAFACNRDTFRVNVFAPLPELEMAITSPLDSIELCDTIPFHTIEVFNADLGSAFDLNLKVLMPTGMSIIPGSSEVSYNTASSNFLSIPDPQDLGNGNYSWDINDIVPVIKNDGLPGVTNSPDHSFSIRFLGFANCGLIASAPAIVTVSGRNSCDDPTNTLSKPGEEINVKGLFADYEANITPDGDAIVNCGGELELTLKIQASGPTAATDSILVTLPPGIDYVNASYVNVENAVTTQPVIQTRGDYTVLKWAIIEGLSSGTPIRFKFKTIGYGEAGCIDEVILVQTIQSKSAFCKTTNDICPVFVQSGSSLINIDVQYPDWQFTNFTSMLATSGVDYNLSGANIGEDSDSPLEITFYLDQDGNGFLSPGDMLITSRTLTANEFINGTFSITGTLNINENEICNVIAVISPENNCTCSVEQIVLSGQQSILMTSSACSEETIQIGVNQVSGANYYWNTPQNLSCSNCPMADFNFINNSNTTQTFNYILTEDTGNCPTMYLFEVTVFPIPRLLTPDSQICEGDSIELITTPAQIITWDGPGLVNSNDPTPIVSPSQTAIYTVDISNGNCSNTGSVTIDIIPSPIADAGRDTSLCNFTGTFQLEAFFNPNYSYFWQPNFLLNDFLIHNPTTTASLSTEFILMVEDDITGCTAIDSVFIDFGETPELSISSDVTICGGESIELFINGAESYEWSPSSTLNCGDCQKVIANPSQTTTYYVTGSTADMCDNRDSVTVFVEGFVKNTFESAEICEGDTYDIFGTLYSENKIDTMVFSSISDGCDSTHIINLTVVPSLTELTASICEGTAKDLFGNGDLYDSAGNFCDTILTASGCDSITCLEVSIVPPINIQPQTFSYIVEPGDSVQLIGLPDGFTYRWELIPGLTCYDCREPFAKEPGEYTATIYNADSCSVEFRFDVNQCNAGEVVMPNIFSPNGDSQNEMFCPIGADGQEVISLRVFNRWGQKIYDGRGANAKWDGTYKGEPQPVEVYVYIVELGCGGEIVEKELVGDVTLMR